MTEFQQALQTFNTIYAVVNVFTLFWSAILFISYEKSRRGRLAKMNQCLKELREYNDKEEAKLRARGIAI